MSTSPQQRNTQRGFTLVEVMVSLMIFMIVVLAAIGSLYSVNSASRKVQSMRTVLDNVTFAVESISRTIRTGQYVICGGLTNSIPGADPNCPFSNQNPSSTLLVYNTLGTPGRVQYRAGVNTNGGGSIQKQVEEGCPFACVWGEWISLTAPEVNVQNLSFYVDGADSADGAQTSVAIVINGVATTADDVTSFAVQTYVSERATE